MLIFLPGFTSLYLESLERLKNRFWCPGEIIQIDVQITFRDAYESIGLKRLSFDEVRDRGYVREVYTGIRKEDNTGLLIEGPGGRDKCLRPATFLYSRSSNSSVSGEYLHFQTREEDDIKKEPYEAYNRPKLSGKILPSLILHDGIINCVITFI